MHSNSHKCLSVRQIGVLVPMHDPFFRGMLQGLKAYRPRSGSWSFLLRPPASLVRERPIGWEGAIGHADAPLLDEAGRPIPTVAVTLSGHRAGFPAAIPDYDAVATSVADHLLERGIRHFAGFVDRNPTAPGPMLRESLFAAVVTQRGASFEPFITGPRTQHRWTLEGQIEDLAEWLSNRPYPLGVMAGNDEHGWRCLVACRRAGLSVPDQVAVVGMDDDPILCEFCDPPLSSVAINQQRVGYEAAAMLDRLLLNEPLEAPLCVVPIEGVITRQSSDLIAVEDELVAGALREIRSAQGNLSFNDLLARLRTSQSTLYRRFHAALGRSPSEELFRARLQQVRRLLINTNLPLVEIAVETGYEHVSQLSRDVRKSTGLSPTQLRRRYRTG